MSVAIDGVRNDDRIYWTLWYSAWLHFTIHYYTHTSVHSHFFISRCSVAASNGNVLLHFGSHLAPASATSFSQKQFTMTEPPAVIYE
jgi:hypothetical protein